MAYGGPETPVSPPMTRIYVALGDKMREEWNRPERRARKPPLVQASPPFLSRTTVIITRSPDVADPLDIPQQCTVLELKRRIMQFNEEELPICRQRLRFDNRPEELEDYVDAGNASTSTHRYIETVLNFKGGEILVLDRLPDVPVGTWRGWLRVPWRGLGTRMGPWTGPWSICSSPRACVHECGQPWGSASILLCAHKHAPVYLV